MFTTGSKFFFGATLLAIGAFLVYGIDSDWELMGSFAIASFAVVTAFLGGTTLAFRDANLDAPAIEALSAADAEGRPAVAGQGPPSSLWPALGGFALALTAVGLVLDWRLFVLGLAGLLITGVEWVVGAWADRASADPAYNERLRARVMHPIEFPILGVLCAAIVIFGFSRVMLALPKDGSIIAFISIGVIILLVASLLSIRPRFSANLIAVLLVVGAVAALTAGVIGIAFGERGFGGEEEGRPPGANEVGDKAASIGTVISLNGQLAPNRFVVPRSLNASIIFENKNSHGEQALVLVGADQTTTNADGAKVTAPQVFQTAAIASDKRAVLTFRIGVPGIYELRTEGDDPQAVGQVVVP
jgi:hypothetical protein